MKKIIIFITLIMIPIFVFAFNPKKNWVFISSAASSSTIVTPASSEYVVIKGMLTSVQNACNLYLHTGTKTAYTRISPFMFLPANGTLNLTARDLDFYGAKGEAVKIWFNTAPGSTTAIDYRLET